MTILLIEDSADYAELVQLWLSGGDHAGSFRLHWTDSLVAGLERLAKGGVDVILLDLGLPDSDGTETFAKTKAHAPGIPIVVLSAADTEALALQMIQSGAADYLVKSTCTASALVRAVKYAVVRQKSQCEGSSAPAPGSRILGVIGAKGGAGATTVAATLAAELRRQSGQRVLLAGLDIHPGLVPVGFGVEPQYTLRDVARNLHRLDQSLWDSLVTRADGDLHILPWPGLRCEDQVPADTAAQVLTLIRPFYEWIVLDLGRLDAAAMRLRERMHDLFLVTDTALAALYETKRIVDTLVKAGTEEDRLRLIINQVKDGQPLPGSEIHQVFGIPVYATIEHDREELRNACFRGALPAANSVLHKQIATLARRIAGLPEERPRRTLPRLLSFADRFRRTSEESAPAPAR